MRLLRAATLVVADPDATARHYADWFDYRLVEAGVVPAMLAASWGAPAMSGRRFCLCRPASGAPVFVRLVQGHAPPEYRPLRSYGWAAIEICVQDVLAVDRKLRSSPFTVIGPPRPLDGLPTIFPMQVRGPDQEIIFLTQIDGDPPGQVLPRAACAIDTLFILVLACSDMHRSLRWFKDCVGYDPGRDMELAYGVLSDAFGLPSDHKHRIATMTHDHDVFLELDQYPADAAVRAVQPGELPPGIAVATFASPDLTTLAGPWITPPAQVAGALYGGAFAGTMRAPDGSLVELVAFG